MLKEIKINVETKNQKLIGFLLIKMKEKNLSFIVVIVIVLIIMFICSLIIHYVS